MATMRDTMEGMIRGEVPPPPVADLIGFRLVAHATSTCMALRGERAIGR